MQKACNHLHIKCIVNPRELISILFLGRGSMNKNSFLLKLIFAFFVLSNLGLSANPFNLIFISDIHCRDTAESSPKLDLRDQILTDIANKAQDVEVVGIAGDLTNSGNNAEFNILTNEWITPINHLNPTKPHGSLYLCKGNHDEGTSSKSNVLNYLKAEYGDFKYSFDVENLHVICCGKYPDKALCCCARDTISWLQSDLEDVGPLRPVVIFFHFNILGTFSDWWGKSWDSKLGNFNFQTSKSVKDALFAIVRHYNVKSIFFGHYHRSYAAMWRQTATFPGIRTAGVGGDKYAFCTYTPETQDFDIQFKDKNGKLSSWESMMVDNLQEL